MVDALLDEGGYTHYGIEVGRAVDATVNTHASASDPEADTSNDDAPSLLPETTIKGVADDDFLIKDYHVAGDGIL